MTRALPLLAAVVMAAAVLSGVTTSVAPDPTRGGRTVTLLTGDRVRVTADQLMLEPGTGRHGMTFDEYEKDGHRYVVRADAP